MTGCPGESSLSFGNSDKGSVVMQGNSGKQSKNADDAAAPPDDPDIKEVEEILVSWRSLFNFTTRKHIAVLLPAALLVSSAGILKPTISIFLGHIFDDLILFGAGNYNGTQLVKDVSIWCIALTGLGLAIWLINGGFFALWLIFGELQAQAVRDKLFAGLLEKEMDWYDLRKDGIHSLLIRVQTQIRELQTATSQPLAFFVEDTAAAMVALGIAFYYSWKLTLVILALVPVAVIILSYITSKLQPAIEAQKRELTEASKYANTAITAVDTVKAFNGQDQEIWQYSTAIKTAARSYLIQANSNALQMGISRFMTVAMFVAGFWYGMVLVQQGLMPGQVLATFYSCLLATQSFESLLPQWIVLAKGLSAGETLKQIVIQIEHGRKVTRMVGSRQPEKCHGDVEVTKVSFSYPSNPEQAVLNNVSFFFPAGETTFVLGRSGCGKSTLSNLLLKYYEPSQGSIFIDGEAIQTLNLDWLRNNVTLVQQQGTLFHETLFTNVAFGRRQHEHVAKQDVQLACQISLLQGLINDLPEGLDTVIGPGGSTLSGGQTQRVEIARAWLRNAPILILDEATSALDHTSRTLVMHAIREWRRGLTTIIITHDIAQILDDDFVYVLDGGRVVEEGYRNRLAEDTLTHFSSFLPIVAASEGTSERRRSDVTNSVHSTASSIVTAPTRELSRKDRSGIRHISNFLGFSQRPTSTSQINSRRGSLGLATALANTMRADSSWQAPDLPAPVAPADNKQSLDRLKHLSTVFGVRDQAKKSPDLNNRNAPLRRTSAHSNSQRTGNLQSAPKEPVQDYQTDISEPLTQPLSSKGRQRSFARSGSVATIDAQGIQLLKLMGEVTNRTRDVTTKVNRSRSVKNGNEGVQLNAADFHAVSSSQSKRKPSFQRHHRNPATIKRILSTVWPVLLCYDRIMLIFGFVSAFINAAATPAFSYVLSNLLGNFSMSSGQEAETRKWALLVLLIAVIDATSSYFFHYCLEYSGQVWVDTLRIEALKRILAQPKAWFDRDKNSPLRLNECLDRNAEEMRNLVGRFAGYIFVATSMIAIAIIWSFIVCWKLTIVGLAAAPAMYALTRAFETVSSVWEAKTNAAALSTARIFTETFSNIRAVRALTLESYFKGKQTNAGNKAYKIGVYRALYSGFFFGLSDSTNCFVTALILYFGAVIVTSQQWTVQNILAVITLLLFSSGNANAMLAFIPQINSSQATATTMLHLANLPKSASHEAHGTKRLSSPLPIALNNLSFSYPSRPRVPVLKSLSASFHANTCTAIVGTSGCGKSTFASLLLAIYPTDELIHSPNPQITFAGTSIFSLHIPSLRSSIALVPQKPFLFPTSIFANITYGLREDSSLASMSNVEHAAREAGIHDFIASLPDGYRTRVGEGGIGLSGGQAQRVAIARAVVRRPRVLVMDEPTSALDEASASVVREMVARVAERGWGDGGDVAVVVVTHSEAMMRVAGRIMVLDAGMVVEEGSWEELVARRASFWRLTGGDEVR